MSNELFTESRLEKYSFKVFLSIPIIVVVTAFSGILKDTDGNDWSGILMFATLVIYWLPAFLIFSVANYYLSRSNKYSKIIRVAISITPYIVVGLLLLTIARGVLTK